MKDEPRNRAREVPREREGARFARTRWRILRGAHEATLLELLPETGRPHQLRLACASLGCPLLGDLKYGASAPLPDKSIALHARELRLVHPTTKEELTFVADTPARAWW